LTAFAGSHRLLKKPIRIIGAGVVSEPPQRIAEDVVRAFPERRGVAEADARH
jgi:hypothetical protein